MSTIEAALPQPTGDPRALRALADTLRAAAARGGECIVARDAAHGLRLSAVWDGSGYDAAIAEATAAGRLITQVGDRLVPAAAAVSQFAEALEAARRTVSGLREEWLAGDRRQAAAVHRAPMASADLAAHVALLEAAGSARQADRTDLIARHAACLRSLEVAETTAAHAISGTLGEAVSPAGQRLLLLAQLPLTQASAMQADAAAVIDRALAGHAADPRSWTLADIEALLTVLGTSLEDPLVARALMERLGPRGLQTVADTLWLSAGDPPGSDPGERGSAQAALDAFARAFVGSVAQTTSDDPGHLALVEQWLHQWIDALLAQPVAGLTSQMALVATAAAAGRLPGPAYAAGALRALVRQPASWPLGPTSSRDGGYLLRQRHPMPDPFQALLGSIGSDPGLARRILLAPGAFSPTLVGDLIVHRPLSSAGSPDRLDSSAALGRLLLQLAEAGDRQSPDHQALAGGVLEAVSDAGLRWWPLEGHESVNVARHLDPFRRPAAMFLSAQPSLGLGSRAGADGGDDGSARLRALLGEIARDPDPTTGAPSSETLLGVLAALAAHQGDRLSQAMAAQPATPTDIEAAGHDIGFVVGFAASSATLSLVQAGRAQDSVNEEQRTAVRYASELAGLVPLPGGFPLSSSANALVGAARRLAVQAFENANPVDHETEAAAGADRLVAEGAALASLSAKAAVRGSFGDESAQYVGSEGARSSVTSGRLAALTADPARNRAP